jgi:hypothetical protein
MDRGLSAWPLAEPLDDYLREVVQTLRQATDQGIRKLSDDPAGAERALADCADTLDVILAGDVLAWIGN